MIKNSYSNLNNKIIIIDDVLSKENCEKLINYYTTISPSGEWFSTFPLNIDLSLIFFNQIVEKIEKSINECLDPKIKVDWCQIVKWPVESYQLPHYDTASDKTVFTSITYLNQDYVGGETFFVDDMKITPKLGRTLCFDGNFRRHGVSRVTEGIRFTLPIWYKL